MSVILNWMNLEAAAEKARRRIVRMIEIEMRGEARMIAVGGGRELTALRR